MNIGSQCSLDLMATKLKFITSSDVHQVFVINWSW